MVLQRRAHGLVRGVPRGPGTGHRHGHRGVAERLPELPADLSYEGYPDSAEERLEQRRADALWALAATTIARDADVDRATVVVHTTLEGRTGAVGGAGARGVTDGGAGLPNRSEAPPVDPTVPYPSAPDSHGPLSEF